MFDLRNSSSVGEQKANNKADFKSDLCGSELEKSFQTPSRSVFGGVKLVLACYPCRPFDPSPTRNIA